MITKILNIILFAYGFNNLASLFTYVQNQLNFNKTNSINPGIIRRS
jgi:hypothetical protein